MATYIGQATKDDYIMAAAIDFGTTFSGYAFSFKTNPDHIMMNKNWGQNLGFQSYKTATSLLLGPGGKLEAFGFDAEQKYGELVEDEDSCGDYQLYRQFKMMLHESSEIPVASKKPENITYIGNSSSKECFQASTRNDELHYDPKSRILSYGFPHAAGEQCFISRQKITKQKNMVSMALLKFGNTDCITLGLVPKGYRTDYEPGWGDGSVGMHFDDYRLYDGQGSSCRKTDRSIKVKAGDVVKMVVKDMPHEDIQPGDQVTLHYYQNDKLFLTYKWKYTGQNVVVPAIGMSCAGVKVKIGECEPQHQKFVRYLGKGEVRNSHQNVPSFEPSTGVLSYDEDTRHKTGINMQLLFATHPITMDKNEVRMKVLDMGSNDIITIGLVPNNYSNTRQPGWDPGSIGFHFDDFGVFDGSGYPVQRADKHIKIRRGDIIRMVVENMPNNEIHTGDIVTLRFYQNDVQFLKYVWEYTGSTIPVPAIGIKSIGGSVQILPNQTPAPFKHHFDATRSAQSSTGQEEFLKYDMDIFKRSGTKLQLFLGTSPLMTHNNEISIKLLDLGSNNIITFGLVPENYSANRQPGWDPGSVAVHFDDLGVFDGSGRAKQRVDKNIQLRNGDVIRLVVQNMPHAVIEPGDKVILYYYHNEVQFLKYIWRSSSQHAIVPAIGMESVRGKVQILHGRKQEKPEKSDSSLPSRPSKVTRHTEILSTAGVPHNALDIFAKSLQYLKDHIIESVSKATNFKAGDERLIKWVLTVPAIWSDEAKHFMREAAYKAGMISQLNSKQLLIALEPEAASVHCRHITTDFVGDNEPKTLGFKEGTKYMIIDAGGGTIDITAHEVLSQGQIKELHSANGGDWGGTKVDENFAKILTDVLGEKFVSQYRKESPQQWLSLMVNFERAKKSVKPDGKSKISISVPYTMGIRYKEITGKDIEKVLRDASSKGVTFSNGSFILKHEQVVALFDPVTKQIVDHISSLTKSNIRQYKYFLLVGGFGECAFLQKALEDRFGSKVSILIPTEAQMSVIKGAVLFGHKPTEVMSRIARKTYGTDITPTFDPNKHDTKYKIPQGDSFGCSKVFSPFVQKGDSVETGKPITNSYVPVTASQKKMGFTIYSHNLRCQDDHVYYVDDPTFKRIGEFTVDMPDTEGGLGRGVSVDIIFGGTEIEIKGTDKTSGSTANTKIDFLED